MKTIDIPLSRVMAKARREKRKTQTRRVIRQQPFPSPARASLWSRESGEWFWESNSGKTGIFVPGRFKCPYGQPSDRLRWMTTWATLKKWDHLKPTELAELVGASSEMWTAHESDSPPEGFGKLRAGRFMPLKLREWVLPVDVFSGLRVERLNEISEEDAIAEGVERNTGCNPWTPEDGYLKYPLDKHIEEFPAFSAKESYRSLWESINGPSSWDRNDWVWVIDFEVRDL